MENPFTVSREELQSLVTNDERLFSREQFNTLLRQYSRDEIEEQITNKSGPLMESIKARANAIATNTGKAEVINALSLADFYFPDSDTTISFELRRGVSQESITTFSELVGAFEVGTYIDCEVMSGEEIRSFQIKAYPQAYIEHANEVFLKWIKEEVFDHYGDMKGVILVVILQPDNSGGRSSNLDLDILANGIDAMVDRITFDEVVLTYNDRGQYITLCKLYPERKKLSVPLEWALARFRGDV